MIFESNPMNSFFEEDNNFKVEECLNNINDISFPDLQSNVLQLFHPVDEDYEKLFNETDSIVSDEPSSIFELDCNVARRDTLFSEDNLHLRSPANIANNRFVSSNSFLQKNQIHPHQQQPEWCNEYSVPELIQAPVEIQSSFINKVDENTTPVSSNENASDDSDDPLSSQMETQRNGDLTKFCCHVCHKKFKRPSSLKTHMNIHTGDRPYPCPYKECTKSFNAKSNMLRHYKLHFKLSKGIYMLPTGEISLEKPTARQLFQSSKENGKNSRVRKVRNHSSASTIHQSNDEYISEIDVSGSATPLNNTVFSKPYVEMSLQGDAFQSIGETAKPSYN
ncbi:hypothetical protein RNJ44_04096 [Nakaseomyces bracarensis]|uniref:C2H2-type domain-containing protein n=1 Tax=Nakaseomyces bracarensis TaxID=273131 RepID=A0ABR4NTX5_9SACH